MPATALLASTSTRTILSWPRRAAMCSGVRPPLSATTAASVLASSTTRTIPSWPVSAAKCR
eukprot:scaffold545344_cov38-Prasinocladus_malaysianus.AAC.1